MGRKNGKLTIFEVTVEFAHDTALTKKANYF